METLEAIMTRRSVRAFTGEPIAEETLRKLLEAGRASASGGNVQPWGFVLVSEPVRVQALRALAPGIIGQPAAILVIGLDRERAVRLGGSMNEQSAWIDIGIAIDNLLLAAHALGLGACPIGSFHPGAVAHFLGLPEAVQPVLLLAVGIPRFKPESPGRRPLGEVCFREEWGVPYA